MKLDGKAMVAVAMMLGAMAVTGCKVSPDANDVAPEESADTAPVDGDNNAADSVHVRVGVHYYAPHAPPAVRVEHYGQAPSARHFWAPGYYRWNGREHVWIGGRWAVRRDGYEYVGPRWENRGARYEYIPGRWVRR